MQLAGVTDPEVKRKRIGETFVRVFEETAAEFGHIDFMVQGTTYPDVIESGQTASKGKQAKVIKTHHNVGGLPDDMVLQVVEPLRYLFKDEVRAGRPRGRSAEGDRRPPAVPRSRPRDPHHRRGHAGEGRDSSGGGRHRHAGD